MGNNISANTPIYKGDTKNGKKHGKGIYTFPNGERYEGEWENGLFEIAPSRWYDYRIDGVYQRPRRRHPISFTAMKREEILQVLNDNDWKQKLERLYVDENCGNNIVDQLKICGFQNLVSIVIKKNSLQNLLSLEISDNPKLQTIETEDGDGSLYLSCQHQ